jgi:GTP-binding protein
MMPVIAIVGRPNVGKSTLFNRLSKKRDALVVDQPGVTRDRQYAEVEFEGQKLIIIDTGGIEEEDQGIRTKMMQQSWVAVEEADLILFMVDGKEGISSDDNKIAKGLRTKNKKTILLVNKTDGRDPDLAKADFFELGFSDVFSIAASQNRGLQPLISHILSLLPESETVMDHCENNGIPIAIVGRPNVGKSTLVNRILGEERVVVFDQAGTTRDSIFIPMERDGREYVLIDTAGVRRRAKVTDVLEKYSVIKTLQAIEAAEVVVMVFDAREGILDQDLRMIDFVLEAGRALVIAINKSDGLNYEQRKNIAKDSDQKLEFVPFIEVLKISALHGTGISELFRAVHIAHKNATTKVATPKLTRILTDAVQQHEPPMVHGRRIKLRYAHMGGILPPIIVIHGNQTSDLPETYQRFLIGAFRKALRLKGTPIRLVLKTGENPYEGKKNVLTDRQVRRRQRLMKRVK